nr:DUF4333 domain-containing protein [Lysobacter gummosus]
MKQAMHGRRWMKWAGPAAALVSLTGCEAAMDRWFPPQLKPPQLEQRIRTHIAEQKLPPPKSVSCPRKLTSTPGDTVQCAVVSAAGDRYHYRFTSEHRQGRLLQYELREVRSFVTARELEDTIAQTLAKGGSAAAKVVCPGSLTGPVGRRMDCVATSPSGETESVGLTVVEVGEDVSQMRYQITTRITRERLQAGLKAALNERAKLSAQSVRCDGPLGEQVGDLVRCVAVVDSARRVGLTVKTAQRDPETHMQNFEFQLDPDSARH